MGKYGCTYDIVSGRLTGLRETERCEKKMPLFCFEKLVDEGVNH